jgi:hypothetical protein
VFLRRLRGELLFPRVHCVRLGRRQEASQKVVSGALVVRLRNVMAAHAPPIVVTHFAGSPLVPDFPLVVGAGVTAGEAGAHRLVDCPRLHKHHEMSFVASTAPLPK